MFKNAGRLARGVVSKAKFKAKVNSPELLMVGGIVSGIGAIVMACKATTKAGEVIDEHKERMDQIHEAANTPELAEEYTAQDAKKDTAIVYTQTGWKMVKLYAPAIALEAVSIGCVLGSHNILKKRNLALAALYATADKSFKDYRGRVVERFGEEVDTQLKNGLKVEKIESEETTEDGKTKTVKKKVNTMDPSSQDIYVRIFDRRNPNWSNDERFVRNYINVCQGILNKQLTVDGHLMLNDALEQMGLEKVLPAGQVVGWLENGNGDGYVDIKVTPIYSPDSSGILADAYALEFNCDGYILEDL